VESWCNRVEEEGGEELTWHPGPDDSPEMVGLAKQAIEFFKSEGLRGPYSEYEIRNTINHIIADCVGTAF